MLLRHSQSELRAVRVVHIRLATKKPSYLWMPFFARSNTLIRGRGKYVGDLCKDRGHTLVQPPFRYAGDVLVAIEIRISGDDASIIITNEGLKGFLYI
jgi:hypothetical protein